MRQVFNIGRGRGARACGGALLALGVLIGAAGRARAQSAADPLITGAQTPPARLAPISVAPAAPPTYAAPLRMPRALAGQWSTADESVPATAVSVAPATLRLSFGVTRPIGLKEALALALRQNPAIAAAVLEPLGARQVTRATEGAFDPSLTGQIDARRDALPTRFLFDTGGGPITYQSQQNWNIGLTKRLSSTNGALTFGFNNSHFQSNYIDLGLNPLYSSELALTLDQPLLRNFGLGFATIHVRMAAAGEAQARATLVQQLSDFVLSVGVDYWQAARARAALGVARGALTLASNLLELDRARATRGLLPTLAVKEAGSQVESARAQVAAAQDGLAGAQDRLWRDLGGAATGIGPRDLAPLVAGDGPALATDASQWLADALQHRPEFAVFDAALQRAQLDVKYATNQTLPELDLTAGVGLAAVAGGANCIHVSTAVVPNNCLSAMGKDPKGVALPYQGAYADTLKGIGGLNFYHFQAGLSFNMPLANETAQAELARARLGYDQERLRDRDLVNNVTSEVASAVSALEHGREQVRATTAAVDLASDALRAENGRYALGLADSHEVLQFQQELIAAQAGQVDAQANLEVAGLDLLHAAGTLLDHFQIQLAPATERGAPWYTRF